MKHIGDRIRNVEQRMNIGMNIHDVQNGVNTRLLVTFLI